MVDVVRLQEHVKAVRLAGSLRELRGEKGQADQVCHRGPCERGQAWVQSILLVVDDVEGDGGDEAEKAEAYEENNFGRGLKEGRVERDNHAAHGAD